MMLEKNYLSFLSHKLHHIFSSDK